MTVTRDQVVVDLLPAFRRMARSFRAVAQRHGMDVDDLVQDAVVWALRYFDPEAAKPHGRTLRIGQRAMIDRLRAVTKVRLKNPPVFVQLEPFMAPTVPGPEEGLTRGVLLRALASLAPGQRRDIRGWLMGLSARERAATSGISEGSANVAKHTALKRLRAMPAIRSLREGLDNP